MKYTKEQKEIFAQMPGKRDLRKWMNSKMSYYGITAKVDRIGTYTPEHLFFTIILAPEESFFAHSVQTRITSVMHSLNDAGKLSVIVDCVTDCGIGGYKSILNENHYWKNIATDKDRANRKGLFIF